MIYIEGTRPLSWYSSQAPNDDEEAVDDEEERKQRKTEVEELTRWCKS